MTEQTWFYMFILFLCACSVILYTIDLLLNNRKANQMAFWLLVIVWILQFFYFAYKAYLSQALPFLTPFDSLFFYSFLIITFSLVINYVFKIHIFPFFTLLVAFTVLSISVFSVGREFSDQLAAQLSSEWVMLHVIMAVFSYVAFTLSFIFSVIYLVQHSYLKKKKLGPHFSRWPSLERLDRYAFWANVIGLPLLLLSLIMGMIWAFHSLEASVLWDAKVLASILVILVYATAIFQRHFRGWSGRKIAELNLVCFAILIVNYVFSTQLSDFHI